MATRAELVDAAKDLNKVCDLTPPIDVKQGVEALRAQVAEAIEFLREDDVLEPTTRKVVNEMRGITEPDDAEEEEEAEAQPDNDGALAVAEKTGKKPGGKRASGASEKKRAAKTRAAKKEKVSKPRQKSTTAIGAFKPVRRGSRLHTYLTMGVEGTTLGAMVKASGRADFVDKDVLWWLRYGLRRDHGIDYTVSDDGGVTIALPAGKSLEDCVAVPQA